jgi:hypothetical protein
VIDLEREVREVLQQRAEEGADRVGERMVPQMRRRVRRHQAGTILVAVALAGAVGLLAFVGARQLSGNTGLRPGQGPTMIPDQSTTYAVVARGEIEGKPWRLSVSRRGDDWCTRVEVENGTSGGCRPWEPSGGFDMALGHHRGYPVGFLTGQVSKDVGRVGVQLEDGTRIEPKILAPPADLGAPFNVFITLVPKEPQTITILGFDREGNLFHQAEIAPAELEESSFFFEAQDVHGNVVGYLRGREYILGEEWAEPGTPATMERVESIRHVATFPLRDIWPEVREWWNRRPPADASDDAFLDWWASYPVTKAEEQ